MGNPFRWTGKKRQSPLNRFDVLIDEKFAPESIRPIHLTDTYLNLLMQPIREYRLNNSVLHSSSEMIFVISEMQVISNYNTIVLQARRSWFFCTCRTYLYISVLWLVRRNLSSSSAFHHRVLTVRIAVERPSIRSLDSQSIRPQGLKKILLVWYQSQSLRRTDQSENNKITSYYRKI